MCVCLSYSKMCCVGVKIPLSKPLSRKVAHTVLRTEQCACVTLVAAMLCGSAATRAVHAETNKFRPRQWERGDRMSHSWHLISTARTHSNFSLSESERTPATSHNRELAERCAAIWHTCPLCCPHSAGCQTEAAFPPGICVAFRRSLKGVSSYKQRCVRWLWGIFTPGSKNLPQSTLKPTYTEKKLHISLLLTIHFDTQYVWIRTTCADFLVWSSNILIVIRHRRAVLCDNMNLTTHAGLRLAACAFPKLETNFKRTFVFRKLFHEKT